MKILIFSLISLLIGAKAQANCKKWFKEKKLSPISENCLLECASSITDMSTFYCTDECGELCKSKLKKKLLFKYVYYPGLTAQERALIAKYPKEAHIVFQQKNIAENRTDIYFPKGFTDDESDAFRHFIWASLLTKELGSDLAQEFLDAHENNSYQSEEARAMDLANNRAGLLDAQRLKKNNNLKLDEIEKSALKHFKKQKLVILQKRLAVPHGVKKQ